MEKINGKAMIYALLPLLFSGLAGAVDIILWSDKNGCDGSAKGCYGVANNVCCTGNAGSIQINNAGSTVYSKVYIGGGCTTYVGTGPGKGDICYVGSKVGGFTGAFWYYGSRRRSLLAEPNTCDTQMKPNSVLFTEDSTKGHWILTTDNVDALYEEMQTIPDAEKVNWLKSRGAFYGDKSAE